MTLPIEQQVCSKDLAQKLKELGLMTNCFFRWTEVHLSYGQSVWVIKVSADLALKSISDWKEAINAPTVAELISLLQTVAKQDIIVAKDDPHPANTLAQQLIQHEESKI